jgi:hypothetical protein
MVIWVVGVRLLWDSVVGLGVVRACWVVGWGWDRVAVGGRIWAGGVAVNVAGWILVRVGRLLVRFVGELFVERKAKRLIAARRRNRKKRNGRRRCEVINNMIAHIVTIRR